MLEFNKTYQKALLTHALRDPVLNREAVLSLRPDDFDFTLCRFVWEVALRYQKQFEKPIDSEVIWHEVEFGRVNFYGGIETVLMPEEWDLMPMFLADIFSAPLNEAYYRAQLSAYLQSIRFSRMQSAAANATTLPEMQAAISSTKTLLLETVSSDCIDASSLEDDPGLMMDGEAEYRIATGMRMLDSRMDGGLGRGELAMITAPPGTGKTTSLLNICYGAALSGVFPCFLSLDPSMPIRLIRRRYLALAGGIDAKWLKVYFREWPEELKERAERIWRKPFVKDIHFVNMAAVGVARTMENIEEEIKKWIAKRQEKFGKEAKTYVVAIDHLDEIEPPMKDNRLHKQARSDERITVTCKHLAAIAAKMNVAMWIATQSTREGASKTFLLQSHTSAGFHKNDSMTFSFGLTKVQEGPNGLSQEVKISEDEFVPDNEAAASKMAWSINKSRNSVTENFYFHRGPTLRYWDTKSCADAEAVLLKKDPSADINKWHHSVMTTHKNDHGKLFGSLQQNTSLNVTLPSYAELDPRRIGQAQVQA